MRFWVIWETTSSLDKSANSETIKWFIRYMVIIYTYVFTTETCTIINYSQAAKHSHSPKITIYSKSHQHNSFSFLPLSPPGWRGIVVTVRAGGRAGGLAGGRACGRAGGCQTCGTHISVTAWWIFSVRSSIELSRPVVVHCHAHLPICPIWACPWAENLSNLPQIGSRLCGSHISETAGWIYPI